MNRSRSTARIRTVRGVSAHPQNTLKVGALTLRLSAAAASPAAISRTFDNGAPVQVSRPGTTGSPRTDHPYESGVVGGLRDSAAVPIFDVPRSALPPPVRAGTGPTGSANRDCHCGEEVAPERQDRDSIAGGGSVDPRRSTVHRESGEQGKAGVSQPLSNDVIEADLRALLGSGRDSGWPQSTRPPVQATQVTQAKRPTTAGATSFDELLADPRSQGLDPGESASPGTSRSASRPASVFDEIAASMSNARSYDLGSFAVEQRLLNFDQDADAAAARARLEDVRKVEHDTRRAADQQPPAVGTPALAAEFVDDLERMRSEARELSIPLDPGVGGRSIGLAALMPGDIILSTTDQGISETIRAITKSAVSHAAVYLGNDRIAEAIDSGVVVRSLDTAIADDSLAVAYRHRDMTPVKAQTVVGFLEDKARKKTRFDNWAIVRVIPGQLARAVCNTLTGQARERCLAVARDIRVGTDDDSTYFCSELVLAALASAGLELAGANPSWSSPQQIVELNHTGLLDYVGHLKG